MACLPELPSYQYLRSGHKCEAGSGPMKITTIRSRTRLYSAAMGRKSKAVVWPCKAFVTQRLKTIACQRKEKRNRDCLPDMTYVLIGGISPMHGPPNKRKY